MRRTRWLCPLALLTLASAAASVAGAAQPADPRGLLRERTARFWHELSPDQRPDGMGAEVNPTGSPIGGGEGYKDIVTSGDVTVRTYAELKQALAAAKEGQVIFIPGDVEIDMGGKAALPVPGGVTVASDRGRNGSKGALLFSDVLQTAWILTADGPYVRISGLRIRGPFAGTERIPETSNAISFAHFGGELDNNEVYNWAVSAIGAGGARTYVHHNNFHHITKAGLGYSVSVGEETLIEANLFDHGRHFIASSGSPGDSYEARYNIAGPNAISHLFDMHGGRDRGDMTTIAGDWMHIHHNTFTAPYRAVVIRGIPSQGAWVHHNWFKDTKFKPEEQVSSDGRTEVRDNVFGADKQRAPEGAKQ